jgi:phosphoribosylanthranilate isomerase
MVRVKICGITSPGDASLAAELGAHAIGLNFFPESPRSISPYTARTILRELPPFVASVGIFVNWAPEPLVVLSQALRLSAAQLHGDETPQTVAEIAKKLPVIKALRIEKGGTPLGFPHHRAASAFLLDAASAGQFGGTGVTTDWAQARTLAASHRIILAGGLTPENVAEAILTVRPFAVDVASGVESLPGQKDHTKLRAFFSEVVRANQLLAASSLDDIFIGTWQLDPATLNYEHGRPGHRAIYVIERTPSGLNFHLDADDADGKLIKVTYGGALDGRDKPIPGTDTALVLSRLEGNIIESALKRAGKVVDRWTREVLPDKKTMRIIQHGTHPNGTAFCNIGLYRRMK